MSSKKRINQLRKRKNKLAKREANYRLKTPDLAYNGNKYKMEKFSPIYMTTEAGIYEAYLLSRGTITDHAVSSALTEMVLQMRQRIPFPPLPEGNVFRGHTEKDLIISLIRKNWQDLFATSGHPGDETLQGILRTLLGSISIWSSPSPLSRGYLSYLRGFLRQAGLDFELAGPDGQVDSEELDELMELGEEWCETGNPDIQKALISKAEELTRAGEGERVAEVCEELIGIYGEGPALPLLSAMALRGQAQANKLLR